MTGSATSRRLMGRRAHAPTSGARRIARFALALTAGLCAAFGPATAAASADGGPVVIVQLHQASGSTSSYFDVSARPGMLVHPGSMVLVNPSAHAIDIRLDPVASLTTDTLGSAYALTASAAGSTPWIRLSRRRVTIPPRAVRDVTLLVAVPRSARAGDYLSGVAVEAIGAASATRPQGGMSIEEIDRYAIGVELTLPGPRRPAIEFTGARVVRYPSELTFQLLARNTGNVILKNVYGRASVSQAGRVVAEIPLGPGTFVTGTAIAYPVGAPGLEPAEGTRYHVQAVLRYHGGVARLDTWVTFGRAAAGVQQRYAGAPAPAPARSGGVGPLAWVILAAGAALLLLAGIVLIVAFRRRRPLHGRRARAHLERLLAAASDAQPVSLMWIEVDPAGPGGRRRAYRVVAQRMRASDRLCDLRTQGIVLVLPATAAATAAGLALDLNSQLAREGVVLARGVPPIATATTPTGIAEMLAARAAPPPAVLA